MSDSPRVFVITSDAYLWAMWGFAYLFQTYWSDSQEVVVGCFTPPNFQLPDNYKIHSIAKTNFPPNRWSDALTKLLEDVPDDYIVLMLEDYWLTRHVDTVAVSLLTEYMRTDSSILRMDLTEDRMHAGGAFAVGAYNRCDLLETPAGTPYQMSLQTGIWNKHLLLTLLQTNRSAWETEIYTSPPDTMRILGTRQCPVRYANVVYKGKLDYNEINKIPVEHHETIMLSIPPKLKEPDADPITNPG
jgi:hypothetical protein